MKYWLIRKNKYTIVGPYSKDQMLEHSSQNTLNEMDEICAGNGFWFFVKEKKYLEQFLFSHDETRDDSSSDNTQSEEQANAVQFPDVKDLEFPQEIFYTQQNSIPQNKNDQKIELKNNKPTTNFVENSNTNSVTKKIDSSGINFPKQGDLEYPIENHSKKIVEGAEIIKNSKKKYFSFSSYFVFVIFGFFIFFILVSLYMFLSSH